MLPPGITAVRGVLSAGRALADLTWLRVGGPAEWLFQPADLADLCSFLGALDPAVPVFPIGVGSNLIVRDGGLSGVVIRLGRGFNDIKISAPAAEPDDAGGDAPGIVTVGAAALDAHVARRAAEAGVDLAFLRTIPGTIGGAVRMNAGCYGSYIADHLDFVKCVTRQGQVITLTKADLGFAYRHTNLPEDWIVISAQLSASRGQPAVLAQQMADQIARRDASQPTDARSAGSTFRNPAGYSSTGAVGDSHEQKAWWLIDQAGLRGARHGGAQMSPKHPNFLINADSATAADLEELGEDVRKRVLQATGFTLEWEIKRVGTTGPKKD